MADLDLNSDSFEDAESDAFTALLSKSFASAGGSLTDLLGRQVSLGSPNVVASTTEKLVKEFPQPMVVSKVKFAEGVTGMNWLVLKEKDAAVIADLMMGNDGSAPPDELTDIQLAAVAEVLSQLVTTSAGMVGKTVGMRVGTLTPDAQLTQFKDPGAMAGSLGGNAVVRATYPFEIEGLFQSELSHIVPVRFAKQLIAAERSAASRGGGTPVSAPQPSVPTTTMTSGPAVVQPAQFAPLAPAGSPGAPNNVDLLMDVPLQITVELGRANKLVKDILALGPGSIVQLDKLAGEPVDVLVNDKLVARGEVVVIDESFGVRVTDIVSRRERLSTLQ